MPRRGGVGGGGTQEYAEGGGQEYAEGGGQEASATPACTQGQHGQPSQCSDEDPAAAEVGGAGAGGGGAWGESWVWHRGLCWADHTQHAAVAAGGGGSAGAVRGVVGCMGQGLVSALAAGKIALKVVLPVLPAPAYVYVYIYM